jgi:hypothetical protein
MSHKKDLTDQRFGRLKVIRDVGSHQKSRQWECKCDCGATVTKTACRLLSGKVQSCGCLRKDVLRQRVTLPVGEAALNHLLSGYKRGASERNHEFALDRNQFKEIVTRDCFYCGTPPARVADHGRNCNGTFLYNGIDRVDNHKGYLIENCVPCCTPCNFLKGAKDQTEFLLHLKKICDHIFQ